MKARHVIGDVPRMHASSRPEHLAVVDGGRRVSWKELDDRVNRLAAVLRDHYNVGYQDRVAILAGNCLEYVDLTFASSRIAAIYTGLNTRHHPDEMEAQLKDCGAKVLLVGKGLEETAAGLVQRTGCRLIGLPGAEIGDAYEELLASIGGSDIPPHGDAELPYVLTYTSGTTGEPKGVMISSRNEFALTNSLIIGSEARVDDRYLLMIPMFHKGGQFNLMLPAYLGRPVVILPGPDPQLVLKTIESERITSFVAVPTVMAMLVEYLESVGPEAHDLSSVRHVSYGSNPIQPPLLRRFARLFGCSLCQIGGIGTEGGIGLILTRVDHDEALADESLAHRLQSCGLVQPGAQMRLVDDDDVDVPVGEIGEMVFRGDSYVDGYWGRPEASERAWRNGWFHSGDLGRRDEDGYVYYVDRKAGRIKTGGETVFAREVEVVLQEHPAVRAVAVVGLPDEKWGEVVCAVVEVDGEESVGLEDELREYARDRMARFKVPKKVLTTSSLPRTALGKIAVGEVRKLALQEPRESQDGAA